MIEPLGSAYDSDGVEHEEVCDARVDGMMET
jgi:hypothetical protein